MHLSPEKEATFQFLSKDLYCVKSPVDSKYNCFAFAAGETSVRWEPDEFGVFFWPPGVKREYTFDAFIKAFESKGFTDCGLDSSLEPGFEKVAIYADTVGTFFSPPPDWPSHAAAQLPNGKWKSKLGPWEDIEHDTLECIGGHDYSGRLTDQYGKVIAVLKRSISRSTSCAIVPEQHPQT